MPDGQTFAELLVRVRQGEADAAVEIVQQYEQPIRIAVRTRLSDPALRRQFDSMDICQSVLASFFLRAATGQFDLHDPAQLVALLTKMACNKLAMHSRNEYRQRRDVRRTIRISQVVEELPSSTLPPVQHLADRELLDRAYQLMDPQVRQMAQCRANGGEWSDVAAELGGTAEARRKQFHRAIDHIAETLQID